MKTILSLTLMIGLALPAAADWQDRVVGAVADKPILLSELAQRAKPSLVQAKPAWKPGARLTDAHRKILRQVQQAMLDNELFVREAARIGLRIADKEVEQALQAIAKQNGLPLETLFAQLNELGFTPKTYREELGRQILEQRLLSLNVATYAPVQDGGPALSEKTFVTVPKKLLQKLSADSWTWLDDLKDLSHLPAPAPQVKLVGVVVESSAGAVPDYLSELSKSRADQPLDPKRVGEDLHALWATRQLERAVVKLRKSKKGSLLEFRLKLWPRLTEIRVEGDSPLSSYEVESLMGLLPKRLFDPVAAERGLKAITNRLVTLGYMEARVNFERKPSPKGVQGVIQIQAGPGYQLLPLRVEGNSVLTDAILKVCLQQVTATEAEVRADQTVVFLSACGYDRGLLNISVSNPKQELDRDAKTIQQVIRIREGAVFRLGKLEFTGKLISQKSDYMKRLDLKSGQVFSRSKMVRGIEEIRKLHDAYGVTRIVTPLTNIDMEEKRIDLTLQIENK